MNPATAPHGSRPRRQRGVTLIEALVALMVMSFGMVALVGLMGNLRRSTDVAKQRSEAMRLAQAELASLRAISMLDKPAGSAANIRDYDNDLVTKNADVPITPADSNTSFLLYRAVTPLVKDLTEPQARTVRVSVVWQDRADKQESVVLDSVISRADPSFAGALSIAPPVYGLRMPGDRHPAVPVPAKDLGSKISAFRPDVNGSTIWVFNNLTGVIVGKCSIPAATDVSTLTLSDVDSCKNNTLGYLVSGTVRFSTGATANPSTPDTMAQPLGVYLNLTPSQFTIKVRGVDTLAPGGEYPISPSYECFSDAPTSPSATQAFVNYSCIVYPNNQSPRNWWGQVLLSGLTLGTTESTSKVCRYSADYNGDTKIGNEEHPASYSGVSYSLVRQNFLVVRGDVTCPTAPAVDPASGVFVNYSTQQIQPS